MKTWISAVSATLLASTFSLPALAANDDHQSPREPTRGFLLEYGYLSGVGKASVDLVTGTGDLRTGGGIRLGLPGAELIFNGDVSDSPTNEVVLKWGLPDFAAGNQGTVNWSALVGIAHIDSEDEAGNTAQDFTNLMVGATATMRVNRFRLTAQPQLIVADDARDDTFFELGLGADFNLADTQVGQFRPVLEAIITSEDNADNTVTAGVRWIYSDRLTLDIIPLYYSDDEFNSLPGAIQLNASF